MNIAYGSAVQNAFKAILYYEIEETDTTYKVTFKYGGACPYSSRYIAIAENRTITDQTVLTFDGRQLHNRTINRTNYSANTVLINPDGSEYYGLLIDVSQTISKTAEVQTIPVVFTDTLSSFCRYDSSTGSRSSYFGQSTSTLTMTLTVPALAKPTVTATARRDETVDTTVLFEIAVKSFRYDSISTIKVLINGELTEVNGGSIGSSLVINRSASVEGNSQGPLTCSVIAVGRGGESAEYQLTVPSSFFTMDIGGKGKSIAFGEPAPDTDLPDNGQFVCAMDADFKGDVTVNGTPIPQPLPPRIELAVSTHTGTTGTIANGAMGEGSFTASKAGWTPIALCGFGTANGSGSGSSYAIINIFRLTGRTTGSCTVNWRIRAYGGQVKTNTLNADILWMRTV